MSKKDSEDTKQKKIKLKKADKKAAKQETGAGDKDRTFFNISVILYTAAVLASLCSAAIVVWKGEQDISENQRVNQETALNLYSQLASNQARQLGNKLDLIETLIISNPALMELDAQALSGIKTLADEHLKEKLDFRIFLLSQYELDRDAYPPVNFATQKQLLSAETSEATFPDFYKHNKGNYFSVAKAIRHPQSNDLLYTLLVSYPADIVLGNFPDNIIKDTRVTLSQSFDGGDSVVIYQTGNGSSKKTLASAKTIHPNWKIEYASTQQQNTMQNMLTVVAIGIAISIVLMFSAIFLGLFMLKKGLSSDISLVYEFVRSANSKAIPQELFKTGMMLALYKQLKELNPAQTKQQSNNKSSVKEQNFDIDIAAGDQELFGSAEEETPAKAPTQTATTPAVTINPNIFRAYDIRGIVDETLTAEAVKLIGRAIGSEALQKGDDAVIVARDGRLSGPALGEALKQGILASGADVIDIGMVPTPLLYFACKTLVSSSGVMLTGSHNPSNHNGLKIVIKGTTLSNDGIQALKKRIDDNNFESGAGSTRDESVTAAYMDAVENDVILAQPMNVVIDCGNGVTGMLAQDFFERIGCNVTPLFTEVDGNFPNHHPDPSQPKNLQALIDKVKECNAHIGFAFDGDGDRVGVVTNTGKIIWPDRLMMLFAKDILSRSPGADIIFDVKCSNTLADVIRKHGGRPLMWKTGHSLIKAKLLESGAQLAGEMSGHIFFNDRWYGFDDGLYTAARLLEIISTDGIAVDDVFSAFPEMVSTPEINIAVDDDAKFDMLTILASVADFGEGNKTDIDGIRVDYPDGWGLVRASNTTANLVTRFEARTPERLAEIQALFKEQLLKVQSDLEIPF